jgi:hypothetical protein
MSKERYNQIFDEAYNNYKNEINRRLCIPLLVTTERDNIIQGDIYESTSLNDISRIWTKEEFVNKCESDKDFSERWELKLCYCGNPVDTSNPDCVMFNLCEEHQMDA